MEHGCINVKARVHKHYELVQLILYMLFILEKLCLIQQRRLFVKQLQALKDHSLMWLL